MHTGDPSRLVRALVPQLTFPLGLCLPLRLCQDVHLESQPLPTYPSLTPPSRAARSHHLPHLRVSTSQLCLLLLISFPPFAVSSGPQSYPGPPMRQTGSCHHLYYSQWISLCCLRQGSACPSASPGLLLSSPWVPAPLYAHSLVALFFRRSTAPIIGLVLTSPGCL